MANDDAAPCDCGMAAVQLTSPPIDLLGRTGTALECSVYLDQAFGGGPLRIEASTDGSNWTTLKTIFSVLHQWQPVFIDLGSYDGVAALQLRFAWSDNNQWTSGVAIDDVCVYERATNDLVLVDLMMADVAHDAFDGGVRSLVYRQLPLEQATSSFMTTVVIMNRGTASLVNATAEVRLLVGGIELASATATPIGSLDPGTRASLVVDLGWSPSATGQIDFEATASFGGVDDVSGNEEAQDDLMITGPGWDAGYNAMALDLNSTDGSIGLDGEPYSTGSRYELEGPGSMVHGVHVRVDPGSEVGGMLRARLFDGNLNELALSDPMHLTADDLWAGSIFIPFTAPYGPVSGDVIAMVKHEPDSGWVRIATSGASPHGAAFLLSGTTEAVAYPTRTPIVRLALADGGTAVPHLFSGLDRLSIAPVPASKMVTIQLPGNMNGNGWLEVFDPQGMRVRSVHITSSDQGSIQLTVDDLPGGTYAIALRTTGGAWHGRAIIVR